MTGQEKFLPDADNSLLIELIGQAPLPILILGSHAIAPFYFSPGFSDIFGYTFEDLTTFDDWYSLAYPDPVYREEIRARWQAATEAAVQGIKNLPNIVARVTCKDGTVRQIEFLVTASQGYLIVMFKDVTERIRAEEALRESERYNRMLFESSPVGLALNRMDGSFADVNAAFARITGYGIDEIISRGYWALTPDDYAEEEARQMEILQREGRFGSYEKEYIHKDGHRIPVRMSGVLIEQAGEVFIWSSVEDISDQKKAEAALRESEQRERVRAIELEAVLNSVPLPVFIAHDAACKVITVNRAAHEFFGVPERADPFRIMPEVEGQIYRTTQNGVELPRQDRPMQRAAASGEPVVGCPLTILLNDGTERQTICNAAPLFDTEGKSRGAVGVLVDITEQLKTETALRESEQRERARAIELETVLDSVPMAVFIGHDVACQVMTGNQAAYEMIGVPVGVNPSKTYQDGKHVDYKILRDGIEIAPKDLPMQRAAISGQPVFGAPLTIVTADGIECHTLCNAVPLLDAEGQPRGAVAVLIDITEQLKIEISLRESEQRERARAVELETVLDSVPLPVFIAHDPECRVITGNRAAYELVAVPPGANPSKSAPKGEEPGYRTLRDGVEVAPEDLPMQRAARSGVPIFGAPLTILWPDGTERQALSNAAPLFDSQGQTRGAVGVFIDITEQLKAKKDLQDSLEQVSAANQQLRFQFDHVPVAYIVWDSEFRVTSWNPAAERVFGWTAEEAIGNHAYELMTHSDVQVAVNEVWRKITQGEGKMEYSINENITKDGKTITCEWFNAPLRDSAGNVVACLSMVNDISERINAESQLRLASSVLENCREAIVVSDNDRQILAVNPAFTKVTGYTAEEALGKNTALLLSTTHPVLYPEILQALVSKGHWQGEVVNRRKNGESYPSLVSISAIKDAKGNIVNRIGFFIDITNQRKAEEELRQSQKLQSIGTLAGGISHDLNNLLTPIIGLTELVLDDIADEASKDNLRDVLSAAERAQQLVAQILAFSRKDAPNRRRLLLAPTLEKTIDLMRIALPSNVRITKDIQAASPVSADETQIQQIIMNLCLNAAQAMGLKGGELLVSLKDILPKPNFYKKHQGLSRGPYVEILVRDSGCGMSQHTLSRIFEPFFTTKEVGEGTGMGLSVVHGIVTAHQGVIEVESEIGMGATFRVRLPAAADAGPGEGVFH